MINEKNFSSLATLRNLASSIEKEMRQKHTLMQETRNSFLSLQRQYKDIFHIIEQLEKEQSDCTMQSMPRNKAKY